MYFEEIEFGKFAKRAPILIAEIIDDQSDVIHISIDLGKVAL